jgi:hypothetical protein
MNPQQSELVVQLAALSAQHCVTDGDARHSSAPQQSNELVHAVSPTARHELHVPREHRSPPVQPVPEQHASPDPPHDAGIEQRPLEHASPGLHVLPVQQV